MRYNNPCSKEDSKEECAIWKPKKKDENESSDSEGDEEGESDGGGDL